MLLRAGIEEENSPFSLIEDSDLTFYSLLSKIVETEISFFRAAQTSGQGWQLHEEAPQQLLMTPGDARPNARSCPAVFSSVFFQVANNGWCPKGHSRVQLGHFSQCDRTYNHTGYMEPVPSLAP